MVKVRYIHSFRFHVFIRLLDVVEDDFALARFSAHAFTLDANRREQMVSCALSRLGDTLTNINVLQSPPGNF